MEGFGSILGGSSYSSVRSTSAKPPQKQHPFRFPASWPGQRPAHDPAIFAASPPWPGPHSACSCGTERRPASDPGLLMKKIIKFLTAGRFAGRHSGLTNLSSAKTWQKMKNRARFGPLPPLNSMDTFRQVLAAESLINKTR
jgi:hypothetical protein